MASMWRQAMLYLGLGPDEGYDELDELQHPGTSTQPSPGPGDPVTVVTSPTSPATMPDSSVAAPVGTSGVVPTGSVRTIPITSAKPHVVAPRTFNEAQQLADRFKADQPVIVNLQTANRDLARRIIDFVSGLCYALGGKMEKVADHVYLLAPSHVNLAEEERQRLQERGLHY
ncbi:MAG: cell division protein SepF [Actinomycetota bacterium]|jgi:cell division inhibitor SepF|nr:cell division protein SepF [Actinomycetota bacterium]|tara:strand:- start:4580 stop:5095 length:516 start_codon:yes stop_codon:yes gene_type:complete